MSEASFLWVPVRVYVGVFAVGAPINAWWEVLPTVEAHQSVLRGIGEDARAALAGFEKKGEHGEG